MRVSLPISFLVHSAILFAGVIVLPSPDSYKVDDQESIPVDIVDISEISKRVATQKDAPETKPAEKPAPPKVEQAEKPKPAPEPAKEVKEAVKEPTPLPEPKSEAKQPDPAPLEALLKKTEEIAPEPKTEPKPEPAKKVEAKPVPLPRQKPKPPQAVAKKDKKPDFNPDDIAALLNKVDDKKTSPVKVSELPGSPLKGKFTSLSGSDDQLSADMIDWLRQQVETCWTPPTGAREAQNLVVRVRFSLGQDGTVLSGPDVLNSSIDPLFQAAAASAVRAVLMCAPYQGLPLDKYDAWSEVILNFDPSRMLATN